MKRAEVAPELDVSAVAKEIAPPLASETLDTLTTLAWTMSREQLLWSSGYLAGLAAAPAIPVTLTSVPTAVATTQEAKPRWLILYATETGNARRAAEALDARFRAAGLATDLVDLRNYDPKALRRARHATFIVATHGLGDAPEGTEAFFAYWQSARAPRLDGLRYSVLALGDSSYEDYCAVGKALDARLAALGAERVYECTDCDVDYDGPAEKWSAGLLAVVGSPAPAGAAVATAAAQRAPAIVSRGAPFAAAVLTNQKITGRGSTKDVRHVELSLEGSGLTYEPGDAIGVFPQNPPELVAALLEATGLEPAAEVVIGGDTLTLRESLTSRWDITKLGRSTLRGYANAAGHEELTRLVADPQQSARYLATHQLLDLVIEFPARLRAQQFSDLLRRLTPRLYSVASSLAANPDEAHLTVGVVRYERFGRAHYGAASSYLAANVGAVPIYVESNPHFRLPADGNARVIMIGAGTGIAPFRAFLQHRVASGARGPNWLFYGDRTLRHDFLYQLEWQRHRHDGVLRNLDVAFSRDQDTKIYVQQRLDERGAELYEWLEEGAHLYVCGDAERLAPDVHAALRAVVATAGGRSLEDAEEYLQGLKSGKRYQRDVY